MKLDPYGDRLWTWQTGTAQDDRGHSIQLDTTGNIFVGGSVGSGERGGLIVEARSVVRCAQGSRDPHGTSLPPDDQQVDLIWRRP